MSKYFSKQELRCSCCGECKMDQWFMVRIDHAREESGFPWKVTSGYRCDEHDNEIDGMGNHPQGKAIDIETLTGTARFGVLRALVKDGFRRIGIGSNFIHVDTCEDKPQNVVWLYGGNK